MSDIIIISFRVFTVNYLFVNNPPDKGATTVPLSPFMLLDWVYIVWCDILIKGAERKRGGFLYRAFVTLV